ASRAARGACVGMAVCLVAMLVFSVRGLESFLSIKRTDLAATEWLQARVPPGASVVTFGLTLTLQHYTGLDAVEIYAETPTTLADRICGRAPVYAYLDVANLESQWAGLSPEINYRWLRDGPGLTALGRYQDYSLFEIGGCE
ncbi:MAG TPA: hypothetical protein VJ754_07535, partial [Anaerolineae bacterium]|nr:hypothetical protein [Anaerolineae bacterium]